jgi:two-component system LytT family sensor kinase
MLVHLNPKNTNLKKREAIYWSAQIFGWSTYVLLAAIRGYLLDALNLGLLKFLITTFILGILLSHLYRSFIIWQKWDAKPLPSLIVGVLFSNIIIGFVFTLLQAGISDIFFLENKKLLVPPFEDVFFLAINWIVIFILWSSVYFAVKFLRNYRSEEIKNLKYEALKHEVELNNLKSQLNPHFMFNSMNSIRALIDEEPNSAKDAVTQLSNLLRSSLLTGKKKFIPLAEELKLVKDYLALEKIRYEERLQTQIEINPELLFCMIPPLMLQTLVENSIKHGISTLPEGGKLIVEGQKEDGFYELSVINSGNYNPKENHSSTKVGLQNTKKRLKLLYGNHSKFSIENILIDNKPFVLTKLRLPLNIKSYKVQKYESISN